MAKQYTLVETGEIRDPEEGEYFINKYGNVEYAYWDLYWLTAKILKLKVKKTKPKRKVVKE